ncbi:MAG TPA: sigma-70 family RNA polymerase sigma factor [Caulobacteraceae bacterium]|jgi:RNA polymerase sigma-70 factor (ECF subfamily)|nr:sigma-70 family RNA polymerase sigma factor [Caulobacteraceae bacterium]
MTESEWGGLMTAAQAGNGGAYRRLLQEVSSWLCRYYARRLPASMVDDAAQDTLIAIHQRRHTYDPSRPFEAWLGAIARYKWIDRLRALKRMPTEALTEEVGVEDHGQAVISATVLDALLRRLKPAQSQVIRLVKIQGYSVEEAAAHTGQSVSLVKVNIHRGLSRLASVVQKEDHAEA